MKCLIIACFFLFHLFTAHTQKIIRPVTPSVKQAKKQAINETKPKPKRKKVPTEIPAFADYPIN
jgi:hypothetical protein